MGKICDPPPFKGGQLVGVAYSPVWQSSSNPTDIRAAGGFTGAISGIEVFLDPNPPYAGWLARAFTSSGIQVTGTSHSIFSSADKPILFDLRRSDGQPDTGGDPPSANCRCSEDSCRVDCASAPNGFCCIDHAFTDRLLQVLQN